MHPVSSAICKHWNQYVSKCAGDSVKLFAPIKFVDQFSIVTCEAVASGDWIYAVNLHYH